MRSGRTPMKSRGAARGAKWTWGIVCFVLLVALDIALVSVALIHCNPNVTETPHQISTYLSPGPLVPSSKTSRP